MPESQPVLDQVNLVVRDMEVSAAFYRLLGLRIDESDETWSPHHRSASDTPGTDLDLDSMRFAGQWDRGWPRDSTGVVLGFRLPTRDDVDRLYQELTGAGHQGQQEPYDAFWGARYAVVEDPDGNAVGLMSPPDAALRTDTTPPDQ